MVNGMIETGLTKTKLEPEIFCPTKNPNPEKPKMTKSKPESVGFYSDRV